MWEDLSETDKLYVHNHFRGFIELLALNVHKPMLEALIYFLDPTYNVFSFGKSDLLPAIEEYMDILNIDIPKPTNVFDAPFDDYLVDQVVAYFGIQYQEWYQAQVPISHPTGWTLDKIRSWGNKYEKIFLIKAKLFILAFFGIILFPK